MNENIDLTKILEGLEGIELYSSLHGKVIFERICYIPKSESIIIVNRGGDLIEYYKDGKYYSTYEDAECILFPSKEQRDWSKFVRPIKKGTIIVYHYAKLNEWYIGKYDRCINKIHYVNDLHKDYPIAPDYIIPLKKFNPNDIEESLKHNIQK